MLESVEEEAIKALYDVKALLRTPEQWTRGAFAEDADGMTCEPGSSQATCWCIMGAVNKVATMDFDVRGQIVRALALAPRVRSRNGGNGSNKLSDVLDFNDNEDTSFEDVVAALDEAIALVENGNA